MIWNLEQNQNQNENILMKKKKEWHDDLFEIQNEINKTQNARAFESHKTPEPIRTWKYLDIDFWFILNFTKTNQYFCIPWSKYCGIARKAREC